MANRPATVLSDLAFHILLALGEGPSHGYAIGRHEEAQSGGRLDSTTGALYQALRRLWDEGLIAPADGPDAVDPRRKYFALTREGRRAAAHEARRLDGLVRAARQRKLYPRGSGCDRSQDVKPVAIANCLATAAASREHRALRTDMQNTSPKAVGRRALIKGTAMLAVAATARAQGQPPPAEPATTLADVPPGPSVTVTVERRGDIVLVGLNRPFIQNRIDPPTRMRLAAAFYQYEHDPSLRALVLFGHGECFSRGIDVDAAQAGIIAGQRPASTTPTLDPLGNSQPHRSKPVVVAAHGDTWNLGHEIYLASDVRVAAANTRFGQDENTHGRFPGGGATVRFVREAGWGNAMRYMLTGDHWSAEESYRMGITQQIAATPEAALEAAVVTARKIAACAPLSIKATLTSAHQYVDPVEADALSKLGAQYAALYRTEDFIEGRRAEAEGRPPRYQGK